MANKKVNQLSTKSSVLTGDLIPIADSSTGQLYKATLSSLGAVIGSAVASVNGLVGVVVLDTDDIQELATPTNKWFTDTRARAALSASSPLTYNSGTGAFGIQAASGSQNGYLSSTDWTTFNNKVSSSRTLTINGTAYDLSADRTWTINSMVYPGAGIAVSTGTAWGTSITDNSTNWNTAYTSRISTLTTTGSSGSATLSSNILNIPTYTLAGLGGQPALSGTGFVKISGTTISYDNSTYLTTSSASSTYLPLTGGTLTGALSGTSGTFSGAVTSTLAYSNTSDLSFVASANIPGYNLRSSAGGRLSIVTGYIGADTSSILVGTGTNNPSTEALRITHSSGAATFSSSITATNLFTSYTASYSAEFYRNNNADSRINITNTTTTSGSDKGLMLGEIGVDSYFYNYATGAAIFGTSATERMRINSSGNVGIGTTTPQTLLSIENSGTQNVVSPIITSQSSGTTYAGMYSIRDGAGDQRGLLFQVYTANVGLNEKMRLNSSGSLLINSTTSLASVFKFQVGDGSSDSRSLFIPSNPYAVGIGNGASSIWYIGVNAQTAANGLQFYSNNLGAAAMTITTTGALTCYGTATATAFYESSDATIKTLIEDNYQAKGIESVTAKLYLKNGVEELGYFAQDVQPILPSAVNKGADGLLNLSYREVHTAKIARLEKEIEELKAKLN